MAEEARIGGGGRDEYGIGFKAMMENADMIVIVVNCNSPSEVLAKELKGGKVFGKIDARAMM